MKKIIEQIKEKIIITLILSMLGIGATFLYNAGKEAWNLPETVRQLKKLHTQDSTRAIIYISRLDSISRVVGDHDKWLDDDYKTIQRVKNKLKLN